MRISVVIPAYNAGACIERAICSVLAQSRAADEIIVVDDGSTDNTAEIVRRFTDRVKLIGQVNAGVSTARNAGIRAAVGDWIAFLDSDDEWLPDYLKMQTELLSRNPHLVWSAANYVTCYADRRAAEIPPAFVEKLLGGKNYFDDYFDAYRKGFIGCSDTMLIRKPLLLEAGLFPVNLHIAEDIDLWWRIAYRYPQIGFLPQPLAIYHLGTPESGSKQRIDVSVYGDFIRRHLELSDHYHCRTAFEPAVQKMLRLWIRGMLFDARGQDIRQLLKAFPELYPGWYRVWMTLLTVFPTAAASVCRGISKVIRTLNLRRRVVAPPRPVQK
ncbi:MAG: glycosyltransferase [Planctomycetes bacterium]|nr:glycosyltransferase [Planctomycetota bacterium]